MTHDGSQPSPSEIPVSHSGDRRFPETGRQDVFGLALLVVLFVLHAAQYWAWVEDDAFITLRYAANLVAGEGLVFNPGQQVEGYSNLAWVLLAAAAQVGGAEPLVVVRLVGILCGAGCLLVAWLLARRLRPEAGSVLLLAPLWLAASPVLARHAVSGLETNAYALCFALGLWLLVGGRQQPRVPLVVLILILLSLLRPEGAAFGVLFLLLGQRFAGRWLVVWCLFAVVLVALLAWRWWYFGSLLPNTFHFKMTGHIESFRAGFYYTREFLRDGGGAVLVGFALALLLDRRAAWLARRYLVVIGAQVAVIVAAGGDWMHHYRFLAPLLPILAAALGAGVGLVIAAAGDALGRSRAPALVIMAMLAVALSSMYLSEREVWNRVMPSVRSGQYLTQSYTRVGLWLRDHTPPGSVVAISDVGAVGYHSGRPILDMLGLVDHHIARTSGGLHGKHDPDYVLSRRPDYVVLVEMACPGGEVRYWRLSDQALAAAPGFLSGYRLLHSLDMGYQGEIARIYERRDDR